MNEKLIRIGPYRLVRYLGEGAMGSVYLAEQKEPVRRRVAIKLVKSHATSDESFWRFSRELNAMALMNHHNIAQIYDAGTTDDGTPFIVMEYVHGEHITQFCDLRRYSLPQRIDLFIDVCNAVQYAHQKGVIHRDLKPSNILVFSQDGRNIPKIIDFGVAKAMGTDDAETARQTIAGQQVGTLIYMSPEQLNAEPNYLDTRIDIYALGLLLYQLVTGSFPFKPSANYVRYLRQVLDSPAPTPSRMMALDGDQLRRTAALRDTSPRRLIRQVRGDLDWIILRAIQTNRDQRYPSAAEFGADLGRYLRSEPIPGQSLGMAHSIVKFVRRHTFSATVLSLTALFLIGGISGSVLYLARVNRSREAVQLARRQADEEILRAKQLTNLMRDMLTSTRFEAQSGQPTMGELLEYAEPMVRERFRGQPELLVSIRRSFAETYLKLDQIEKAGLQLEEVLRLRSALENSEAPPLLDRVDQVVNLLAQMNLLAQAERLCREGLNWRLELFGDGDPQTRRNLFDLGEILIEMENLESAVEILSRAASPMPGSTQARVPENPGQSDAEELAVIEARADFLLGKSLFRQAKYEQAEPYLRRGYERCRLALGDSALVTLEAVNLLRLTYEASGQHQEAEKLTIMERD